MAKNIRGDLGVINSTGKLGASAKLLNCQDKEFWNNIEEEISSTVKILLENGFKTLSSCQGHDAKYNERFVSVVVEEPFVQCWEWVIVSLNKNLNYRTPIYYRLLPSDKLQPYHNEFLNPVDVRISFGNFMDQETQIKQKDFENYFRENSLPTKAPCQYSQEYKLTSGHINSYSLNP